MPDSSLDTDSGNLRHEVLHTGAAALAAKRITISQQGASTSRQGIVSSSFSYFRGSCGFAERVREKFRRNVRRVVHKGGGSH